MLRFAVLIRLLLIVPLVPVGGRKRRSRRSRSRSLSFVVLRDSDGKPIKNASVVIHSLSKDGSKESEGFQLKTDTEGRAFIDGYPLRQSARAGGCAQPANLRR